MLIIISVLSCITGICLIWGIFLILTDKRRNMVTRMEKYTQSQLNLGQDNYQKKREKIKVKTILRMMGKVFATRSFTKKVEKELLKADILLRGEEFIVINLIIFLTGGAIGFFLMREGASLVFATLGLVCPFLFVKRKKQIRFEKLNLQIGDCLTVMTNSLRAGYSLQQTMDLVSREMTGPLAMEFGKTLREINFGTPTEKALANLAARVESEDMDLMITAVLIQRQIGGNLAEVLDSISHTLRERIRIKGEIKTLTAQGRISGLIIGLMPPILFAVLLVINPGYISVLIQRQVGLYILIGGIISEVFGVILIRKIVNIEV